MISRKCAVGECRLTAGSNMRGEHLEWHQQVGSGDKMKRFQDNFNCYLAPTAFNSLLLLSNKVHIFTEIGIILIWPHDTVSTWDQPGRVIVLNFCHWNILISVRILKKYSVSGKPSVKLILKQFKLLKVIKLVLPKCGAQVTVAENVEISKR